ncbi:MAG: VWA domain-containing protein [Acidimicrobiales bacterium]|nr:VWA domain-containing protein [Acidimicrobiales bacterium]
MSGGAPARVHEGERLRRWRLVLGAGEPQQPDGTGVQLQGDDQRMDAALSALYDAPPPGQRQGRRRSRAGGLAASAPNVARWLGDIRRYFPTGVVQVMQRDAIDRLGIQHLLLEPEMLEALEPDVHLVSTLLELQHLLPDTTRATARSVVGTVVQRLEQRLGQPTVQAVSGALARTARTRRPRHGDIDWDRTVLANLKHYQPDLRTVVPERLVGYSRLGRAVRRELIIAIDQSASMGDSIVYAGVFGAALASIRSLRTRVVAFDTAVVDLSDHLHDPIEVLFGVQLGGGTDLDRAMAYCQSLVERPDDTVLVVISDLHEGTPGGNYVARLAAMARSGVRCVALLALSDEGAPSFDHTAAEALAAAGVPAFACTPDAFPGLIAAAIDRRDLASWASDAGLVTR